MLRILKWVSAPVLAVALMSVDAPQAQAGGGIRLQIGGYGGYHNNGFRVPSYGYRSYGLRHQSLYGGSYYSRPHLHYHAPSLVPHRGHYHYQPGHFDLYFGPHHGHHRGHHHGHHRGRRHGH
ncbi:hypothetical protein [Roseimaritima ulvae]|uniref:Uncharacterized protein n=1 Tax=Roseimaritima ulvae TaxID=980254 RepID=A0A5B9QRN8_9BACT|nr:hypothetical protein [Roseimaritima ulvae]QEG39726.1 hypothetical protein UC8_17240 [Roseimaritima ulvae]